MNFIPEQPDEPTEAPYFDDVTSEDGWRGHTTGKTIDTLKSEIMVSITRLGGLIVGFQRGTFQIGDRPREGFRILHRRAARRRLMARSPGRGRVAGARRS